MPTPPPTFKEAFCDHFKVTPERFTHVALFKTLHPDAGFLFRIFYAIRTVTARESIDFIEKVGETRTDEDLEDVISEFHNDVADTSNFFARSLNQRVSARQVARINQIIRGRWTEPPPASTHFYRKKAEAK